MQRPTVEVIQGALTVLSALTVLGLAGWVFDDSRWFWWPVGFAVGIGIGAAMLWGIEWIANTYGR